MQAAGGEGPGLEFDKDDRIAMSFVAAASNLRSRVFQVIARGVFEDSCSSPSFVTQVSIRAKPSSMFSPLSGLSSGTFFHLYGVFFLAYDVLS